MKVKDMKWSDNVVVVDWKEQWHAVFQQNTYAMKVVFEDDSVVVVVLPVGSASFPTAQYEEDTLRAAREFREGPQYAPHGNQNVLVQS